MKNPKLALFASLFSLSFAFLSCSTTEKQALVTPLVDPTVVQAAYKKIYGASSITSDGTYITLKSNGNPDHKSIYYPTTNALYGAFSGTTFGGFAFKKNPNTITTYNYVFKIPVNPVMATKHVATPLNKTE
jgi:hypothetical protein